MEQFKNYHCSCWLNIQTEEIKIFEIHSDTIKQELYTYLTFLKEEINLAIGFNIVNYDYPMLHKFIENVKPHHTGDLINTNLKKFNDIIIGNESNQWRINEPYFQLIDLFRVHHYFNKGKTQSLKGLQFEMGSKIVMETPIPFDAYIRKKDRSTVIDYCINDVKSTFEFYKISLPKLKFRKNLSEQFKMNLMNSPDSSIGESVFLKLYCNKTKQRPTDVKKLRTKHDKIDFKDLILPYINFETEEFRQILLAFQMRSYMGHKLSDFQKKINGVTYVFGVGGIHGSRTGLFETNKTHTIIDSDVSSFYPSLAIVNKFYPVHLGETFIDILKNDIVDVRKQNKKLLKDKNISIFEREKAESISDALKLASNSVYGKSSNENSFLYDVSYTYKTTINGQLSLLMFIEMLTINLKYPFKLLQANTDGITCLVDNRDIENYYEIGKKWEQITKLELEHSNYKKMFLRDVNNYISIDFDDKIKEKGAYEIIKKIGSEIVYHKDTSFRIVPIAVQEYFVNNTSVENTIKNCKNILHFLGRQKFNSKFYGIIERFENKSIFEDILIENTEKVTRYYVSKGSSGGGRFIKISKDNDKRIKIHDGFHVKTMQVLEDVIPDDINYNFYIDEAIKLINPIIMGETN